jgi:hypothetical protein
MLRRSLALFAAFSLSAILCSAQIPQKDNSDQQAYCTYLTEQAKAQSDLLRSPSGIAAFTQPNTGLPSQLVAGAQLSLSNLRKSGITLDAARKNCELYSASTAVQTTIQYTMASLEKDALTHRLALIADALNSLNALIDQTSKMVIAQNMTRPMLLGLISNRVKLESDRAQTESSIAALYVPPLSSLPLKQQVVAKQTTDLAEQRALAHLAGQSNWDVALTVGAHQQVNPPANNPQPFGEVNVTYNFASKAIDRHLDRSVEAYGSWKRVQEGDAARGMQVLQDQLRQSIAAQQTRLQTLAQESREFAANRELVKNADTSAALDFRNQIDSTQILLGIESADATYRLDHLQQFLHRNF